MIETGQTPTARPEDYRFLLEETMPGRLIMEDLVARFARPAVDKGGIDAVLQTYKRAGAREVLDYMLSQINAAPQAPQGEADDQETAPPA